MTVVDRASSGVKHYLGLSTDDKPETDLNTTIPVGSDFLEYDTGKLYLYSGVNWFLPLEGGSADAESMATLIHGMGALLTEMRNIRLSLTLTGVAADIGDSGIPHS